VNVRLACFAFGCIFWRVSCVALGVLMCVCVFCVLCACVLGLCVNCLCVLLYVCQFCICVSYFLSVLWMSIFVCVLCYLFVL
jgi:hypothetical protein